MQRWTEVRRSTNEVPLGLQAVSPEETLVVQPNALASGATLQQPWLPQ
ncbi:MAG: hypothetical protein ACYDBJ_02005 [Aggregatilineales bacterium]